jgi:4-azaleucine resistance transporter AzlC
VLTDGVGIAVSVAAFALVYGLAARQAGLSFIEGLAMSVVAFAGAAQFAALGLIAQDVPWVGIVVLTALLNARHLLYAASLAPWFARRPRRERAWQAHFLTDEAFALVLPAFRALGRHDTRTYLIAISLTFVPWVGATIMGMLFGELLPAPTTLGLDVVFPAAMAGLAVALVVDRRALVALIAGGLLGVAVALVAGPSVGVLAGGLLGPAIALLVPETRAEIDAAETSTTGTRGLP